MIGNVKSGLGEGKYWIDKINPILIKRKGIKLFPGTLNIQIEKKYKIEDDYEIIEGYEYGGIEQVLLKQCEILGEKAYIVRPKRNNVENGDHPLNIIEVVANVNLREKYHLKDNDKVEIYL